MGNPTTLFFFFFFFFFSSNKPCTFLFILTTICILTFFFYTLHPLSSPSPPPLSLFRHSFLSSATNATVAAYLKALTLHPHLAGTEPSLLTTHYVLSHFSNLNLTTHTSLYQTLLSYPLHSSLSLQFPNNHTHLTIPLSEQGYHDLVGPYHAYSPSGQAYAEPLFVNYGTPEDYNALAAIEVNVSGCVVVARRGREMTRHDVIRNAERRGAVAVLLYTEEGEAKGFERGTVMDGVGDPLTPGWGGVEGAERLEMDDAEVLKRFPKIPSMPLSVEAAGRILEGLGGPAAPVEWRASGVKRVGPGPTVLNLTYEVSLNVVWHFEFERVSKLECSDLLWFTV